MNAISLFHSSPELKYPHPKDCMTTTILVILTVGIFSTAVVTGTNELMVQAERAELVDNLSQWQWSAFSALGVILACLMVILFRGDDWKENLARFIGAMVVGLFGSQITISAHPTLNNWSANPILMMGMGFFFGLVGFSIAKWGATWMMKRAPEVAEQHAEDWAHRRKKKLEAPTEKLEL